MTFVWESGFSRRKKLGQKTGEKNVVAFHPCCRHEEAYEGFRDGWIRVESTLRFCETRCGFFCFLLVQKVRSRRKLPSYKTISRVSSWIVIHYMGIRCNWRTLMFLLIVAVQLCTEMVMRMVSTKTSMGLRTIVKSCTGTSMRVLWQLQKKKKQ